MKNTVQFQGGLRAALLVGLFCSLGLSSSALAENLAAIPAADDSDAVIQLGPLRESAPPDGYNMGLSQSFGSMGRFQLAGTYWFNTDWAVGLETGFDYGTREYTVMSSTGQTYLVRRTHVEVIPQVTGAYTLVTAKSKRLILVAGMGPVFSKPEGGTTGTGLSAFVGPGFDWPLASQLSLHLQTRLALVSHPDPTVGVQMGFQPLFAAHWWF